MTAINAEFNGSPEPKIHASSWWLDQPQDGFSEKCVAVFVVNTEPAPAFISRAEFVRVHGGRPHRLKKTRGVIERPIPIATAADLRGSRRGSNAHIGSRLSAKAVASGSLLGANVVSN